MGSVGRTQESGLFKSVGTVSDDESIGGRSLGTKDGIGELGDLQNDGRVEGLGSDVDDLRSLDVGDVQELRLTTYEDRGKHLLMV